MFGRFNGCVLGLFLALVNVIDVEQVSAGASPSQWVIVVNGESTRSRTIANHYAYWRNIPDANIIVLGGVPKESSIKLEDFKNKILLPVFQELGRRNLTTHIQGVAYSSDFPYSVDLGPESVPEGKLGQFMTPVGSTNGLTYLYRFVRELGHVVEVDNNWYAGRDPKRLFESPNGDNEGEVQKRRRGYLEEKRYAALALLLDDELAKYPDQFPMAYQSAQAWAEAGQLSKAIQQLQRSIELGWTYGKYILEDEHLKSLHEFNRFQALVRSCEDDPFDWTPAVTFDARRLYAPNGVSTLRTNPTGSSGVTYMLSMMLAACGGPTGNTEKEVLSQLKRSIEADFSHPDGAFYFTRTDDVRTKCREQGFNIGIRKLEQLGFRGETVDTPMPMNRKCLGVTMGEANFSWVTSKSTLEPGALGDNLTSWGGIMDSINQTKVSEFLRHGAAAAGGTVDEPYTIQSKFPHPTIHAYYAAGLTSAEAFYSSVPGPYQLLIVGDPLCQPFAKPPRFEILGVKEGQQVGDGITLELKLEKLPNTVRPQAIALLVDGVLKGAKQVPVNIEDGLRIPIPGKNFSTGAHEIRLIGLDGTRIGTRYEKSVWVLAGEEYNQVKLTGPANWKAADMKPLVVDVVGTDSEATIQIRHSGELITTLEKGKSKCEVPTELLGKGPVRLQAVALIGGAEVASLPITVVIE